MTRNEKVWVFFFAVTVLLTLAARFWVCFPGDVAVTRFVQSLFHLSTAWAQWISSSAKFPWNLLLLAVTLVLSWRIAGRRAVILALASFMGMWALGRWLGPFVARPRPSPEWVHVPERLSGFSFPSIFALVYASTIGFLAILFARKTSAKLRSCAVFICCGLLLFGWMARIVLGAHWPSDVILSYGLGLLWAALLIRFL